MSKVSNTQVVKAFELFKSSLRINNYHEEHNVYFSHGQYELGPKVTFNADLINLTLLPNKTFGRNFWSFEYDYQDKTEIVGNQGVWRLYFFGLKGFPGGFSGNEQALVWFTEHTK